jgi:hypothetical protein
MDMLLELLVMVVIVPPLICCALQALAMVVGVVLPWVMLAVIALGGAACLGAGVAARRRMLPPIGHDDLPARVLPVRRPPGIADRRQEHPDY